jgi:threonine/homoserine/homoserine lactone efflux protein
VPSTGTLLLFAAASMAVVAVPGPNVLFVLARGIGGGRRAAVVSVLGVETATLCFVAAAAFGLTAVLVSSAVAFATVRYAGAAYLVYLGVRALLDRTGPDPAAPRPPARDGRTFRQAFAVGIANPKVALFFVAFLPQFVSPDAGSATRQVLVLGLVFLVVATVLDLGWALLAGLLAGWLRRHPALLRRQRFATGPVYLGLGAYAAVAGGRSD